ncbi:alpha/beta fold hydrolase [Variovorax saccharolyticus]|uniref:alpha/beta fold hydrolase n=1 Tax=Variovorax saccharolyticus TaxID=3053516 RepID=UPI0025784DA6|nr:alpha/beta hydrolase [Variovorax sp. J22R187]MDM0022842.1 alpha/beta hydrolase [Variovorax sp. J22R187]
MTTAFTTSIARTPLGPIEYAVVGEGIPVLVIHGSPGGIDAAELMARFLPKGQFKAILVSRPGYLRTPLGGRLTIDQQADLLAALLDQLGIARTAVYTWSGGGPAGYRLAVRHPGKLMSLVAFAAVSQAYHDASKSAVTRLMFTTSAGRWLMRVLAAHQPRQYIAGALGSEGNLTEAQLAAQVDAVFADDTRRRFILDLGPTAEQGPDRRDGYHNDLEQFGRIESLELERITAPTLIVQGTVDSDLPPEQSYFAAETIPGASLLKLEEGTHLALYTHADCDAAQQQVISFLSAHAS